MCALSASSRRTGAWFAARVITATMNQTERVSIVAFDPAVLRVLEITGVDTVASVHSSLDAAL